MNNDSPDFVQVLNGMRRSLASRQKEHEQSVPLTRACSLLPSPCRVRRGATWRCWPAFCRFDWLTSAADRSPLPLFPLLAAGLPTCSLLLLKELPQPAKAGNVLPLQGAALHGPLGGRNAFISLQAAVLSFQCLVVADGLLLSLQGMSQAVCMLQVYLLDVLSIKRMPSPRQQQL